MAGRMSSATPPGLNSRLTGLIIILWAHRKLWGHWSRMAFRETLMHNTDTTAEARKKLAGIVNTLLYEKLRSFFRPAEAGRLRSSSPCQAGLLPFLEDHIDREDGKQAIAGPDEYIRRRQSGKA